MLDRPLVEQTICGITDDDDLRKLLHVIGRLENPTVRGIMTYMRSRKISVTEIPTDVLGADRKTVIGYLDLLEADGFVGYDKFYDGVGGWHNLYGLTEMGARVSGLLTGKI